MKLLFITHKIHELDDDFAFTSLWVKEFIRQGFDTKVICLDKGIHTADFTVYSLGKDEGLSQWQSLKRFWKLINELEYERVFVHMNPKWVSAGFFHWLIKQVPVYLWYTHYTMHIPLRMSHFLCKRLFAATVESMPQYNGDIKKVVTGHGVDTSFWEMNVLGREKRRERYELLSVHRICRSKRIHLAICALQYLPDKYTLTIYGRVLERDYKEELDELVTSLGFQNRVRFMGSVPMPELRSIYPQYQIMVNMAPETIDKTVVEGMLQGVQPVTTQGNRDAIGLSSAPWADTPEAIAHYIRYIDVRSIEELQRIARENHSLESLVQKMGEYIKEGK